MSRWTTWVAMGAGCRPSFTANRGFAYGRRQMGIGANGAGQLTHSHPLAHGHQPFEGTIEFVMPSTQA